MPIYKGSTEVTSGNLYKGSTNIENGYKEANQFYVNTNAIIIDFVDAISGASMSTTQFSSTGTPGSSFTPFTRLITVDAGRTWASGSTVTVAKSGDTGNNVTAYIVGGGSTAATLHVNGTHPTASTTVTLTVNGTTQVDQPNLIVSVTNYYTGDVTVSTEDGSNLGSVTLTPSPVQNCPNSSTSSVTHNFGNVSSGTYYGFTGCSQPSCPDTAIFGVTASKAGYDSGYGQASYTEPYPLFTPSYDYSGIAACNCTQGGSYCPTTLSVNANCQSQAQQTATNCSATTYPSSIQFAGTAWNGSQYELAGQIGTQVGSSSTYTMAYNGTNCGSICGNFCNNGPDGNGGGPWSGC